MVDVMAAGTAADGAPGAVLSITNASKTFGRVRVLHGVSMSVLPGEIRALVGENGSGKSTLIKLLAGYHTPDPGVEIAVAGRVIAPDNPGVAEGAGLRFVHQDLALVSALSTVENLGLGVGYGGRYGRPVRWRARRRAAAKLMADLGYEIDVDLPVGVLQASERTAVAVARAVSAHEAQANVLVLDEPTATLPGAEVERLFRLVRQVRDSGVAVLFVSHHLNEVFELADSVTVLRNGRLVTTCAVSDLDEAALVELMVGRPVERSHSAQPRTAEQVTLSARGITGPTLHGVDLDVAPGEIVGIAGITGSGREAVAALLFGADARAGTISVAGQPLPPGRPDLSMQAGMALVPAERATTAVFHGHDVAENVTLARCGDFFRRGVRRRAVEKNEARSWLQRLDVRPQNPVLPITALSGGNTQKVILARWLRLQPKVLLLDEPTQGVDVGAKEEIHQRIEEAAEQGCAVLVGSTDSEELARLCHRVTVLVDGRVSAHLEAPISPDDITAATLSTVGGNSP